ncbi:hypothetical protein DFJ77DRAFT_505642 [Powellomyces hirtus]|nr:hypothetical protein DFJ77DRAFT_505642 [Powellomyces hirtus]
MLYDDDDSGESDVSLLEALSGSEKFAKGNITFDWSRLPTSILTAVPNPPQSAKKQLQNRRTARSRREKENLDPRPFVSEKLAQWAGRSLRLNDEDRVLRNDTSILSRSLGSEAGRLSFNRSRSHTDQDKLYTFNNCQFTYSNSRAKKKRDATDVGLHSEDEQTRGQINPNASTLEAQDEAQETTVEDSRLQNLNMTGDSSFLPASGEPTSRLDIRQLLDIVQDLQKEEKAAEDPEPSTTSVSPMSDAYVTLRMSDPVQSSADEASRHDDRYETLLTIHQDLSDLAQRVKDKNANLKLREQDIQLREEQLSLREARIAQEADKPLSTRERKFAANAQKNVERYEESLSNMSKENKRLQSSVKDLIASNKQAREQIRKLQEDAHLLTIDLNNARSQARMSRERFERLKSTVGAEAKNQPSRPEDMRGRTMGNNKVVWKPARTVSTQTPSKDAQEGGSGAVHEVAEDPTLTTKLHSAVSSLMQAVIACKRCSDCDHSADLITFETLVALFPDKAMVPDSERAYLQFALHALLTAGLCASERYTLAQMGYSRLRSDLCDNDESRMLLQLIVLSGVTQPDVLQALLENIASEVSSTSGKLMFLGCQGVDVVHAYLGYKEDINIPFMASAVLLIFCSEGEWLREFLMQCSSSEVLDSLSTVLNSKLSASTVENVSVILQKMSRLRDVHSALRSHPALVPRLRELIVTPQSDFLAFNVRSTLNNLDNLI